MGTQQSATDPISAIVKSLEHLTTGNLIFTAAGYIPGFIVAFMFIDVIGRKKIQIMGFTVLTVLFIILGMYYHSSFTRLSFLLDSNVLRLLS